MKKNIFILLLTFLSTLLFSQNYRAVYELKYKPSKEKDSVLADNYALDIFPELKKTNFYNYNYYKNDSIMKALMQKSEQQGGVNINFDDLPKAKFPLVYTKTDNSGFSFKTIDGDSYKFPDFQKINWQILKENKKIAQWNCQKAEADFAGRKWTAWFTTDLVFPEGPYKFSGLPGLITEISDSENSYHFLLEAIYKIQDEEFFPDIYKKAIPVTKKKYEKALENYIKDPAVKLRQGILSDESGNVFHINGGFSKDFIDNAVKERQEKMRKFNNPIELE